MSDDRLHESAYFKTGRCYALLGEWSKAAAVYRDILQRDSANMHVKASLAYVYAMEGSYGKALSLYDELVTEHPRDSSLLKNYILVLLADGQTERAQELLVDFKEKFPSETETISQLSARCAGK